MNVVVVVVVSFWSFELIILQIYAEIFTKMWNWNHKFYHILICVHNICFINKISLIFHCEIDLYSIYFKPNPWNSYSKHSQTAYFLVLIWWNKFFDNIKICFANLNKTMWWRILSFWIGNSNRITPLNFSFVFIFGSPSTK